LGEREELQRTNRKERTMKTLSTTLAIVSAILSNVALAQEPAASAAEQQFQTSGQTPAPQPAPSDVPPAPPQADALPAPAPVDSPPARHGLVLALRPLGVGLPMGNVAKDSPMTDLTVADIPIWLDAGYMVLRQLMLGIYAQYAIVAGGHNFTGSGSDIRLGIQAQYYPVDTGLLNPWVGLGVGYEMLKTSATFGNQSVDLKGFEFAHLQVGLDFRLGRYIGLGPLVGYSIGQYSSMSMSGSYTNGQSSFGDKALHEWLTFSARVTLTL
jgi:hypothetical protein